jgi:hypothetical protein
MITRSRTMKQDLKLLICFLLFSFHIVHCHVPDRFNKVNSASHFEKTKELFVTAVSFVAKVQFHCKLTCQVCLPSS